MATYSIVASDASGSLGVAVQSHWFSVGTVVPFVEAGVGAVAIQSFPNPSHGPRALDLLRSGTRAEKVMDEVLESDPEGAFRQIAIVDAEGQVAAHTGSKCIPEAGHRIGEHCSAQANLMDRGTVWGAMVGAFETGEGDLAERLMQALEAAEAEGGDIRGRQSAAIVVAAAVPTGLPTQDRVFDLRVEDHPNPLPELRRLIGLRRAYRKLIEGDEFISLGDVESALAAYRVATEIVSDAATGGEAPFWTGITLAAAGRIEEALPFLRRAQLQTDAWARLVPRLPVAGIISADEGLTDRLVAHMKDLANQPLPGTSAYPPHQ